MLLFTDQYLGPGTVLLAADQRRRESVPSATMASRGLSFRTAATDFKQAWRRDEARASELVVGSHDIRSVRRAPP